VQLNIHPTISADGYVMLDVTQEINAPQQRRHLTRL
jgi:type II secretory pathway component GspD/PulD (secretin)